MYKYHVHIFTLYHLYLILYSYHIHLTLYTFLGVASIGQVHKAVLKHNKHVIAIKFQNPNIENKFKQDIKTLKLFTKYAMPQHYSAFTEIEKQFITEFNYKKEAHNLNLAYTYLQKTKFKNLIEIPKPYLLLCSKNILIMEYLDGIQLIHGIKQHYAKLVDETRKNFSGETRKNDDAGTQINFEEELEKRQN